MGFREYTYQDLTLHGFPVVNSNYQLQLELS